MAYVGRKPSATGPRTSREAEALLADQNFIEQYKPRFNIRLRDDKSHPCIAISMEEDHEREYDPSFAALPNLVVIDGGRGQLSSAVEALPSFRERGVVAVALAERIEELYIPGRGAPLRLAHDTPELQLLQRVRDEAHRFAITHHRVRRDREMTASIFDGQAGIDPARDARPHVPDADAASRTRLAVYSRQQGGSTVSDERARLESMEATRPARLTERLRSGRRDGRASHGEPSQLQDLVVISGFSGAGKSTAMHLFEDAGYFCVDNLPPEMIGHLADLFLHEGSKVEKAAVVSDVRGGDYFDGLVAVLDELTRAGVAHRLLFLDADEQTLLTRFQETRRRHPLAPTGSVADGIAAERLLLGPLKERAEVVIDTTGLKASQLRRRIADEMLPTTTPGKLAVTFTSFGHKHGPPRDADLSFDVRFLPNPHYEARLRPLTGTDPRIVAYVNRGGELEAFYGRLIPLLDYLLPQYVAEGKAHLNVAIGCTGGRHRSVVIAEHLAALYGRRGEYLVEVSHRDVDRQPQPST